MTLVATNVVARGCSINHTGNSGVAITLYEPRWANISKLEREAGVKFEHVSAPQPSDIAKAAGAEAILQVSNSVIPVLKSAGLSPVELLAKALAKSNDISSFCWL